jgi:hypothetical protein
VFPPKRDLLVFAGKFAIAFVLLMVPWRWVGDAYSLTFSMVSTVALETVIDEREFKLRFEPTADPWGVRFLGTDVRTGTTTELPIEAREMGYVPAATLVALVFASSIDVKRRRTVLLSGLGVLGARVALGVGLPIAHFVGTLPAGSLADGVARTIFYALIEPPDMAYATPLVAFLFALAFSRPRSPALARRIRVAPTPVRPASAAATRTRDQDQDRRVTPVRRARG